MTTARRPGREKAPSSRSTPPMCAAILDLAFRDWPRFRSALEAASPIATRVFAPPETNDGLPNP